MNGDEDFNTVWEIKAIKRRPKYEEALKFLDRVAKQVQPIMRKHNWRVELLSEFCSKTWLGYNTDYGRHVQLRLRRRDNEEEFLPFLEVLDIMLHELCHNVYLPHNASFYELLDVLRGECAELINKGISGPGHVFDLARKPLVRILHKRPYSSLHEAILAAAENGTRPVMQQKMPKRIGGDCSVMGALSPMQAAAMAAERRLQDNLWCISVSEFGNLSGEAEFADDKCRAAISRSAFDDGGKMVYSRKRSRDCEQESTALIDLDKDFWDFGSEYFYLHELPSINNYQKFGEASTSKSVSSQCWEWQCITCTLLNPPLAPICDLCGTEKPRGENPKPVIWRCRFCTLENDSKMDQCGVCGAWR